MALPLMPPVVKYSALAKKATGRGMSAWTITLSRKERWLGATMNGPVLGHVFQADDRGTAGGGYEPAGGPADCLKHCHRCAPRSGLWSPGVRRVRSMVACRAAVLCTICDGARRVQFAVGRKTPAYADAVQSVRSRSGHVLRPVPHHHGMPGVAGTAAARSESAAATMPALPSGTEPCRAGCGLVGGGAADGVERARRCRGAPGQCGPALPASGWRRRWAARRRQSPRGGRGFPGTAGSARCRWTRSARGRSG